METRAIGPGEQAPRDALDEVLEDTDRNLAQELKRSQVRTMLAESQRKEREANRGIRVDDGSGTFEVAARHPQPQPSGAGAIVTSLIQGGLSPEKAQEFIRGLAPEDIAKLNMMSAARGGGGSDMMMPLMLLGKFGSQPQVTVSDMLAIGPKFVESAKTLSEMSRPTSDSQLVPLLTKMIEEASKDRGTAMQLQIDKLAAELKGSDPIGSTASAIKALKDSGLIAERSGETKPETELKIEELRTTREMEMMKLRIDMNKWMEEKRSETERWQGILSTAPAALAIFAKPIEEAVRNAARNTGGTQQVVVQPPQPQEQTRVVQGYTLQCSSCGNNFRVLEPFPDTVSCPKCGHTAPFPKE